MQDEYTYYIWTTELKKTALELLEIKPVTPATITIVSKLIVDAYDCLSKCILARLPYQCFKSNLTILEYFGKIQYEVPIFVPNATAVIKAVNDWAVHKYPQIINTSTDSLYEALRYNDYIMTAVMQTIPHLNSPAHADLYTTIDRHLGFNATKSQINGVIVDYAQYLGQTTKEGENIFAILNNSPHETLVNFVQERKISA